jgi:predicted RNA-binding protein with PUA-like domain
MGYWLVKSEPSIYSWDQFLADGVTSWDGIRNYRARNNLMKMKVGEPVLFYHSNTGLEIVGLAEIAREHYHDESAGNQNWVVVDIRPVRTLDQPVTLAAAKADRILQQMELVKIGRLSVTELTKEQFDRVIELSKG